MAFPTPSQDMGRCSELDADQVGTVTSVAGLTVKEYGTGPIRQTLLTFSAMAFSITDALAYGSQEIYTFPAGIIQCQMCTAKGMVFTTTSTIASTLNSGVTVQWGIGSAAASATTLATTMIDFLTGSGGTVPTFTSSTTINIAPAAVNSFRTVAAVNLNGTSTPAKAYLNLAVGTGTDIDGDATLSVTGQVLLIWQHGGDY